MWRAPDPERFYCMGVDVAGGIDASDSDASAICVVDARTLEQVAEYHTHYHDPHEFASVVKMLGEFYGGIPQQAFAVVETNGPGLTTLLRLKNDLGYWNLYARRTFDHVQLKYMNKLGWLTTQPSRQILVQRARACLRQDPAIVHSKRLFGELSAFIFNDKEKAEARPGEHDDLVFAWMMALHGAEFAHYSDEESYNGDPKPRDHNPDAWVWKAMEKRAEENPRDDDLPPWEEHDSDVMGVHYIDYGY